MTIAITIMMGITPTAMTGLMHRTPNTAISTPMKHTSTPTDTHQIPTINIITEPKHQRADFEADFEAPILRLIICYREKIRRK